MRILVLSIIALASLYTFLPRSQESHHIDEVKMKLGAPNRKQKSLPVIKSIEVPEEVAPSESDEVDPDASEEDKGTVSAAAIEEDSEEGADGPVVTDDHEKGWQDELSQIVVELEPEHGEEMFNAYVSERNGYQTSLDELIRGNQKNQDLEFLIGELEIKHEERVKEIFGNHYEDVKEHHSKFLESETP